MFELNFKHQIIIEDVPLQWMTRLELFTPDLEQFPLMYIHKLINKEDDLRVIGNYNPLNKQRIFGFVLSANWSEIKQNKINYVMLKLVFYVIFLKIFVLIMII